MSDSALQPFEPIVDLKKLDPAQVERAKQIAGQINIEDAQSVIQYGVGTQTKISGFADTILTEIRNKDAGYVGDILSELVLKIKEINVGSLGGKGRLSSIPIIGDLFNAIKKFIARYEKLSVQVEKTVNELDKARLNLLRDITMLDSMFLKNREYLEELDVFIAAGQIKLDELLKKTLPELKKAADSSGDPLDAQKYQDCLQFVNRFEKKLYDLKVSRMVALQTGPQIRLIQNNNQALVEKIQSSILNTIPLWKNQMVIAISLFRQKKALEVQREVTETTNELLAKNSEMLKAGSIGIAKESERGIIDIETLQKVNNDLISTIEETLKIQEDGRVKRSQAETELVRMEQELKTKLSDLRNR